MTAKAGLDAVEPGLIAMRHHHEALERPIPVCLDSGCHLGRGLPGTNDHRAPGRPLGKIGSDRPHGIRRVDSRVEEAAQQGARIANSSHAAIQ